MTNLTKLVLLALLSGCAAFTSPTAFNSPALTTHSARVAPLNAQEQSKWIKAEEQRKYKARTWAHFDSRHARRERLGIPLHSSFMKTWEGSWDISDTLGVRRLDQSKLDKDFAKGGDKEELSASPLGLDLDLTGRALATALRT
jgi:hypothetical protein